MNVLLVGHAYGPGVGSEPGNTWNLAWSLSHQHRVWVLAHPERRKNVDAYLREHPNQNLSIIWVDVSRLYNPWKPGTERGIRLHYALWLRAALRAASRLCSSEQIDVTHHVSWCTVGIPSPFWKLNVPFVWGPIGGGQRTPSTFLRYFGSAWKTETLRNVYLSILPYSPALRGAVRSSAAVLSVNRETQNLLRLAGGHNIPLALECGLPSASVPLQFTAVEPRTELQLLWAGRMQPRKGLPLLLDAMAQIRDLPIRLTVAGDGEMRPEWEESVKSLGLEHRVRFLGGVPHSQMPAFFRSGDAFVFTSIRDTSGSVWLEAMAHGLPIIGLDHQGLGTFVPASAGIKVTASTPESAVQELANALRHCAQNREQLREMGRAAWEFACTHTWDKHAETMTALYREVVSARRNI